MEKNLNNIDPDLQHQMVMVGFKEGQEHSVPSPQTIEMINNLKINNAVINQKLDTQDKKIDALLEMVKCHIKDEEHRYESIMSAKADKWVQNFVTGLIGLICTSVLVALLGLIFIK